MGPVRGGGHPRMVRGGYDTAGPDLPGYAPVVTARISSDDSLCLTCGDPYWHNPDYRNPPLRRDELEPGRAGRRIPAHSFRIRARPVGRARPEVAELPDPQRRRWRRAGHRRVPGPAVGIPAAGGGVGGA